MTDKLYTTVQLQISWPHTNGFRVLWLLIALLALGYDAV